MRSKGLRKTVRIKMKVIPLPAVKRFIEKKFNDDENYFVSGTSQCSFCQYPFGSVSQCPIRKKPVAGWHFEEINVSFSAIIG
jgi:hypothetical protein